VIKGCEVFVSESSEWLHVVEEGSAVMVRGDPVPIGVGDLVVDPGERASGRPGHQSPGLPAEPGPLVLAFMLAG
jgi:hypothetical protein